MPSQFEPWSECDDAMSTHAPEIASHIPPALVLPTTPPTSSEVVPAKLPHDTSRFDDPFSKLFLYETQEEREHGYNQIVTFLHEILSSFAAQRLRPEVIDHWTHLIHLHDTDFLHLQFFMLMLSCPSVVRKLADMTDTVRFCAFSDWLLQNVILAKYDKLAQLNAHQLAHTIRVKWTTM